MLIGVPSLSAATVFEDAFSAFALGEQWQAHGAGAPDLALSLVGLGAEGSSLRLGAYLRAPEGTILGWSTPVSGNQPAPAVEGQTPG